MKTRKNGLSSIGFAQPEISQEFLPGYHESRDGLKAPGAKQHQYINLARADDRAAGPGEDERAGESGQKLSMLVVTQKISDWHFVNTDYSESLSLSRASFRWRRLISPLAAVIKKPAVLSSGCFTSSIICKSSSGILTETCSDLLFLLPVAITEPPYVWWCSVCLSEISNQALTWCSPDNILVVFTSFELVSENDEARQCANTNRASNLSRYSE